MQSKEHDNTSERYFKQLGCNLSVIDNTGNMGKDDRKALVLQFLAESGMALPPAVLFRNLRLHHNATFSEKSLGNYLGELAAAGLVKRVDPTALERRDVVEVGEDERAYYMITEAGVEAAPESFPLR
jgi:hypothetical protein